MIHKISLVLIFIVLLMAYKNTPENNKKINKNLIFKTLENKSTTNKIKQSKTFILKKANYWRTEMFNNLTYYEAKELPVSFHSTNKYGVLAYYSDDDLVTDYYIFNAPSEMKDELTININDALFSITEKELNADMSDFYTITNNHLLISEAFDGMSFFHIINLDKQKIIKGFSSFGEIKISPTENTLTGWHSIEKDINKDTVCPEHIGTDTYNNYIVTQEVKYNLSTGVETKTGKLGCSFIQ